MAEQITRRGVMARLAAGAAVPAVLPPGARGEEQPPAAAAQPAGLCTLLPQAVEGPYYFDPKMVRADITEGRPGAALRLKLRLIEAGPCTPMANVRVDVWHADARGAYSGYTGQGDDNTLSTKGETYLRGTQFTDADGTATFNSIYPGWYPGRTPHIHVKAFLDKTTLVTGQIYFPDAVSQKIYETREPYAKRPHADTTNATDGIFLRGEREGGGTVLSVNEDGGEIIAALVIAVDSSGAAARKGQGFGGFFRRMMAR